METTKFGRKTFLGLLTGSGLGLLGSKGAKGNPVHGEQKQPQPESPLEGRLKRPQNTVIAGSTSR
jgi:hypothetical protein